MPRKLKTAPRVPWTPEENSKLVQNWGSATDKELLKLFPNCNMAQLSVRANYLRKQGFDLPHRPGGAKHGPQFRWTEEELEILLQYYQNASREEILKRLPGRTWYACAACIRQLKAGGIKVPTRTASRTRSWTDEEDEILIKNWASVKDEELLAKLNNRTIQECSGRVHRMRLAGVDIPARPNNLYTTSPWLQSLNMASAYQKRQHTANTSGFNGVTWNTKDKLWVAIITFFGKQYQFMFTKNKAEAVAARERMDKALEPIYEELRNIAANYDSDGMCEMRDKAIARGHDIIKEESRKIRTERKIAKRLQKQQEANQNCKEI